MTYRTTGVTRRRIAWGLGVAGLLMSGGCNKPTSTSQPTVTKAEADASSVLPPVVSLKGTTVKVYMYSEYMDESLLETFKERTGAAVEVLTYEDAETMKAQLQTAGGAKQYDVVVAPDYIIPLLAEANLIQPLDHSRLPHGKNVDARFRQQPYDPGNKLSMPYQWGTNGLVYRKIRPDFQPSYATIFAPEANGPRFALLDSIRDTLGAALIYSGKSANSESDGEVEAAGAIVARAKKSKKCIGLFGSPDAVDKVVAGEADVAMAYSGDAVKRILSLKTADIGYLVPKEGSIQWIDNMSITSGAPNRDGAYAFIDFILEAEIGARLSNYLHYASPNEAARTMLAKEDLANEAIYPPVDLLGKLELLRVPGNLKTYDFVWTKAKSQ